MVIMFCLISVKLNIQNGYFIIEMFLIVKNRFS